MRVSIDGQRSEASAVRLNTDQPLLDFDVQAAASRFLLDLPQYFTLFRIRDLGAVVPPLDCVAKHNEVGTSVTRQKRFALDRDRSAFHTDIQSRSRQLHVPLPPENYILDTRRRIDRRDRLDAAVRLQRRQLDLLPHIARPQGLADNSSHVA